MLLRLLLISAIFFIPIFSSAEELISFEEGQVTGSLTKLPDNRYLLSISNKTVGEPELFDLQNPMRIVVDLPGKDANKNRDFSTDDPFIGSLRIGVHDDKTRLVLDLTAQKLLPYEWQKDGNTLLVTIAAGSAANVSPALELISATRIATDETVEIASTSELELKGVTKLPDITTALSNTHTPTLERINLREEVVPVQPIEVTEELPVEPAIEPQLQALEKIYFPELESNIDPYLEITLRKRPHYRIIKSDSSTYKLVIPDSELASNQLALPVFPPQTHEGFRFVKAEAKDKQVLLSIGVEEGTRLSSYVKDRKILIKQAQ